MGATEERIDSDNYVGFVLETETVDFQVVADRLSRPGLSQALGQALTELHRLGNQIDDLKKAIYYDKYQGSLLGTTDDGVRMVPSSATERMQEQEMVRFLHSIMGLASELPELLDWYFKYCLHGEPIDWAEVSKEYGDVSWYHGVGVDVTGKHTGKTLTDVLRENILKLRKRFPKRQFTEQDAVERKDESSALSDGKSA